MKHQQLIWRNTSPPCEANPRIASSTDQNTTRSGRYRSTRGFTLVEIMIVVVIIGLLALLAIPAFQQSRIASQNVRIINDFRQFKAAFETYALENGNWPDDEGPGVLPDVMEGYIVESAFENTTHVQGNWDWEEGVFGITAAISLRGSNADNAQMTEIDDALDNGDLATGSFRILGGSAYGYVLEE